MILKDLIVNGIARIVGKVYASGGFVGNLEGNVTGNLEGNVTGNLEGNVTGNIYNKDPSHPVMPLVSKYGYWGMCAPDNNDAVYVRTTTSGIIPYQAGGAGSGHQSLGTSSWYFSAAYIDNVYGKLNGSCTGSSGSCTGNAATATKANNGVISSTGTSITLGKTDGTSIKISWS